MPAQSYEIVFTRKAERELRNLESGDRKAARRVVAAIDKLSESPRPSGVKSLRGSAGELYRIRVVAYRVVYAIEDTRVIVEVFRIGHHREVYELFFR